MAFTQPQYPFQMAVYASISAQPADLRGLFDCNLAYGERAFQGLINPPGSGDDSFVFAYVLCPVGTDIRDGWGTDEADFIEVPAGSQRMYAVRYVDLIGAGFANEHLGVVCSKWGRWSYPLVGFGPAAMLANHSARGPHVRA